MRRSAYSYVEEEAGGLSFGARMKRRLRNLCQGDASTSTPRNDQVFLFNNRSSCTINHRRCRSRLHDGDDEEEDEAEIPCVDNMINGLAVPAWQQRPPSSPAAGRASTNRTLEEMIMQLELEEAAAAARKAAVTRRMSCVNTSSDRVLRSARNALNQYPPRFSLDGKDAMYRSSFLNDDEPLRRRRPDPKRLANFVDRNRDCHRDQPPRRSGCNGGGGNVVWCKPGVVPKLMGLDAIPVPVNYFPGHRGPLFF
ncbi:unnamed protein product [Linum tenue]|uniref:DUF3741 domain-containing protein n=1 Tax=Linum tenue TaxID=586396 RepID=A0AAV0PH99_9ROSI|nr:unnamed protein product [Linum tenue]